MERFLLCLVLVSSVGNWVEAQSNYAIHGNDIEYGEGLPQTATLAGKVTKLDTLHPDIKLNRTEANLDCAQGAMRMELRFKEPFYGIAYADFDRNSACYTQGTGGVVTTLELPLKGCGTKQDPQRVFTNNVIVRFHPGLEMEGDEVITIVCRYPPPIVPAPPIPFIQTPPLAPIPKPLKEFEVLLIVCTLLFLGVMLLGLGCSYYCLKQRNIQVIKKRPFTPAEEESEQLYNVESFSNLKLPRVHAPTTGSLSSDYPSSLEDATITSVEEAVAISTHTPELIPPPRKRAPPPVFAQVQDIREPARTIQDTEYIDTLTVIDKEEIDTETRYNQPMVLRKPEVSVHTVDDVYLQTIVEKRLIEDEERRTQEVTQFYKKEQPNFNVVIRTHQQEADDDRWERGSETTDVASSIGWSAVEESPIRPQYTSHNLESVSRRTEVMREDVDTTTVTRAMQKLQADDTQTWNEKWKVLFRVLESPQPGAMEYHAETDYYDSDTASVLTEDDREKWRQIITTESTLRSLLTEATVREDYERIRRDTRYERLFEPEKWDVIIRVLAPPTQSTPAYEEDRFYSDSTSEVSSFASMSVSKPSRPHRKKSSDTTATSTTERKSITDVRSMTEVMVDFGVDDHRMHMHHNMRDDESEISSVPGGGSRSIADRSSTEIVEFAPLDEDDYELMGAVGGHGLRMSDGGNHTLRMSEGGSHTLRMVDGGSHTLRMVDGGSHNLRMSDGGGLNLRMGDGGNSNNFSMQESHSSSRVIDENDGVAIQQSSATRKTFSSSNSRLQRY